MSVDTTTLANLASMNAGRFPRWTDAGDVALEVTLDPASLGGTTAQLAPAPATAGVELRSGTEAETVALLCIDLREDESAPRGWITGLTVANSTQYRVVINGVDCNFTSDGDATLAEILAGVEAAIDASGEAVAAELVDLDEDGTDDGVVIVSTDGAAFTMSFTGSTGTLEGVLEATSVDVNVWAKAVNDPAARWRQVADAAWSTITGNTIYRLVVAGLEEVFVQITSADGRVRWTLAPCVPELEG